MEGFEEFRDKVKNVEDKRHHKINNSYGVYDYYKYYRKNRPKDKKYILTESQYFAIIRRVNELIGDKLVLQGSVLLPLRMGRIEIRKYNISPRIDENGKVVLNAPIDWDKTLKLWYEDEESYRNKVLIKTDSREIFKTLYTKTMANYENKSFYQFRLNNDIKDKIKKRIKEGKMDAFRLF